MKRVIIALLLAIAAFNTNAQTYASNSKFELEYISWTSYSDYAGYAVTVVNCTNEPIIVTINLTQLGCIKTYELNANEKNTFVVNFEVAYQIPYIPGMWIKASATNGKWNSNLKIKTQ